jgi:DNA-binding LacI/PurR family transcriptional regulator
MRLKELFEAESSIKHVTFCCGRMNPPTIGHEKLLETMASVGGDYSIFVSQSQDKKKNPLDYATKIKFIKLMFPSYASHVVQDASLNTIGKVASYLYDQGYRHVTIVGGSDRIDDLYSLLKTYNGVEGKAHGFYKFEMIDAKSSGDREDGAEGVAGVSASGARAAAIAGDMSAFEEATGAGQYANALYAEVRKGLGVKEGITELADDEAYYKFILAKIKTGRPLSSKEKQFFKTYQIYNTQEDVEESNLGTVLKWPEVANKISSAMKAMGWKAQRQGDDAFMFSTKGAEDESQWYMVMIDNEGDGMFTYALGTFEDGRPDIGEQGTLPTTEASVSEVLMAIRDGYGLDEHIGKVKGGYRLYSKHGSKNLGTFPSKAGAEKHEREVQYFKHAGK